MTNPKLDTSPVYTFSQYNETTLKMGADGTFAAQDWSFYKDMHPAKYDVLYEKMGFTWVIKHKEEKVALLCGYVPETTVKAMMEQLSKATAIPAENAEEKEATKSE